MLFSNILLVNNCVNNWPSESKAIFIHYEFGADLVFQPRCCSVIAEFRVVSGFLGFLVLGFLFHQSLPISSRQR